MAVHRDARCEYDPLGKWLVGRPGVGCRGEVGSFAASRLDEHGRIGVNELAAVAMVLHRLAAEGGTAMPRCGGSTAGRGGGAA